MPLTLNGAVPDPDDNDFASQTFKSIYDDYVSHRMDYADQQQVEKGRKRAAAANKRFEKTGDPRHPNTIRAENKKARAKKEEESYWYSRNPNMRTNDEGDIVNPADFDSDFGSCTQAGRWGSFSHGNNSCGCGGCA